MNEIASAPYFKDLFFAQFSSLPNEQHHKIGVNSLKQRLHERKVDEFFLTNSEAPRKKFSWLALTGSALGVLAPILMLGKKQHPGVKLDSVKNVFKRLNLHYGLKEIIMVSWGGALGGLAGGLADRNEPKKLEKIEEASFQLMNTSFPPLLISGALKVCQKSKSLNNAGAKFVASLAGLSVGGALAVGVANHEFDKIFDRYDVKPDRKFKKKDLIIHVDDLVAALILAKIPFVDKLHPEKILPAICVYSGYHVGES